jgi:hypothetical protein
MQPIIAYHCLSLPCSMWAFWNKNCTNKVYTISLSVNGCAQSCSRVSDELHCSLHLQITHKRWCLCIIKRCVCDIHPWFGPSKAWMLCFICIDALYCKTICNTNAASFPLTLWMVIRTDWLISVARTPSIIHRIGRILTPHYDVFYLNTPPPRPVSSRSAKQPGWSSPPIVTIVTITLLYHICGHLPA